MNEITIAQMVGQNVSTHKMLAHIADADDNGILQENEILIFNQMKKTFVGISPEERDKLNSTKLKINDLKGRQKKVASDFDSKASGGDANRVLEGKELSSYNDFFYTDFVEVGGVKIALNGVKKIKASDDPNYNTQVDFKGGASVFYANQGAGTNAKLLGQSNFGVWDTVIDARGFKATNGKSLVVEGAPKTATQIILQDTNIDAITRKDGEIRLFTYGAVGESSKTTTLEANLANIGSNSQGLNVDIAHTTRKDGLYICNSKKGTCKKVNGTRQNIKTDQVQDIAYNGTKVTKSSFDVMYDKIDKLKKPKDRAKLKDDVEKLAKQKLITREQQEALEGRIDINSNFINY